MDWQLEKISYLYLLLLLPLLAWRMGYLYRWKQTRITRFADSPMRKRILGSVNLSRFLMNNIWMLLVFILMVLALVNLLGGVEKKEVKRQGIDMVFVIDVSNSMNATDIPPSRMEKAKKIISEIISKLGGDRVGIVVFAGQAYSVMPLSNDYGAAELYLRGVDTRLLSAQGTNIADAVLEASHMLSKISHTSKAIILVSDGEAHQGEVNKAVKTANNENITIFSIGIGTPQGTPIPITHEDGYSEYKKDENGDIILTQLEDSSLKQLAAGTQGAYFYGGNSTETIIKQVFNTLSSLQKKEQATSFTYDAKPYFQIFIGLALLILICISLISYKRDFDV